MLYLFNCIELIDHANDHTNMTSKHKPAGHNKQAEAASKEKLMTLVTRTVYKKHIIRQQPPTDSYVLSKRCYKVRLIS
jgi:hypothetical protein